jgi:hypothetical protein
MAAAFVGFDWDDGNRAKCQKHGVSLGEIGKKGTRLFSREKGDATLFQTRGSPLRIAFTVDVNRQICR